MASANARTYTQCIHNNANNIDNISHKSVVPSITVGKTKLTSAAVISLCESANAMTKDWTWKNIIL